MNAVRQVIASREFTFDDKQKSSWAWIDPKGKIYKVAPRYIHRTWAYNHLLKTRPEFKDMKRDEAQSLAHDYLLKDGWIAATNPHNYLATKHPRDFPQAQLNTVLKSVIQFCIDLGDDPSNEVAYFEYFTSNLEDLAFYVPTIDEFVRKYGGRKWEDKLYEGLL